MTALRLTPIALPISLQVMPASTQLRSRAIRSGVQVPGQVSVVGPLGVSATGRGACGAGDGAAAKLAFAARGPCASVTGIGIGSGIASGMVCGIIGMASLLPRPYWAADRAMAAHNGQRRDRKALKRKSVRDLEQKPQSFCPACATEPHPASRTQTRRRSGARTTD
jgi:hypothetical protein